MFFQGENNRKIFEEPAGSLALPQCLGSLRPGKKKGINTKQRTLLK
jgi:hypothetical protein